MRCLVGSLAVVLGLGCSSASAPPQTPPVVTAAPAAVPADAMQAAPSDAAVSEWGVHMERAFVALTQESLVPGQASQLAAIALAELGLPSEELPADGMAAALRSRVDRAVGQGLAPERVWAAILAMAVSLDDAHTMLFDKDKLAQLDAAVRGGPFVMPGVTVHWSNDQLVIAEVLERSPGQASGLAVGDVIVAVEGKPPRHTLSLWQAAFAPPGTSRSLTIKRADRELVVKLALEPYLHPVGTVRTLANKTGLIRLYFCAAGSDPQRDHVAFTRAALAELKAKHVQRVVLDLRGNTGGGKVAGLVSLFTAADPILVHRPRGGAENPWRRVGDVAWDKPLAILVDEQTISCGEMEPYALQEHGAGRVFGQPTGRALNLPDMLDLGTEHTLMFPKDEMLSPKRREAPAHYQVVPDEVVPNRTPAEVRAGKDPQLAAAVRWLAKQPLRR